MPSIQQPPKKDTDQFDDWLNRFWKVALPTQSMVTETAATRTVALTDKFIICNRAGTITLTLPNPATYPGFEFNVRTITANTVVSASSNVVPLAGGAAGTAILAATAGKWADLRSDGTNWLIIRAN